MFHVSKRISSVTSAFAQVLEEMPLSLSHKDRIAVLMLDAEGEFPETLKIDAVDSAGDKLEEVTIVVGFFSEGRLGTLSGGLLVVDDQRQPLALVEIQAAAQNEISQEIERRRHTVSLKVFKCTFIGIVV